MAGELAARGADIAFHVVSNPEFLKEGDAVSDFMKPDRVIVGTDSEEAAAAMHELYGPFARSREKLIVMGIRSAEMTKYAANCMLATKISFINEIATLCEKVGADVRDVRTGIGADQRIGYHFIYPGIGYGGSCFPKDVKALIDTAHSAGMTPELLEAVERVNIRQKRSLALRVAEYFEPQGGVEGKTLALWGLAFKANTDDMRESPALSIIEELTSRGMKIRPSIRSPRAMPGGCWRTIRLCPSRVIPIRSARVRTRCSWLLNGTSSAILISNASERPLSLRFCLTGAICILRRAWPAWLCLFLHWKGMNR